MVRLKDCSDVMVLLLSEISIPYGAIKSWVILVFLVFLVFISIPYGAIKRYIRIHFHLL